MDKLLVEKNIKEAIERIKDEISEDKKVICDWHSSYADISVIQEKEGINYIYFTANVYDNGVYSMGSTLNNYDYILNDYFTNTENFIDYHEFKELLDIDTGKINLFDLDKNTEDHYFGLEAEFELRLEREAIELTVHKEAMTYSLHRDPKGEDWNLTVLVENQPVFNTRGDYRDCFDELRNEVKYTDLFIELTRQNKMVNISNTNENGVREGLWVIPKEDEEIKEEICFFENDKLNGKFAEIYKNNEIAEIGTYKENIKEGKAFSYYEDTLNLKEEKNYENGILSGNYKNFLYTGEPYYEGYYVDNEKQGLWKKYDKEGYINSTQYYTDDKEDGTYKQYTKEGLLKYSEEWEYGERLNTIDYYPNGKIQKIEQWADGIKNGIAETFYETGELKEKYNYKNGELEGPAFTYDKSGNIVEHKIYSNGKEENISLKKNNIWDKSEEKKVNPWIKKLKKDKDNELER